MKAKKHYYATITVYDTFHVTELWYCTHEQATNVVSHTVDFILPLARKPRKLEDVRIA